MKESKLFDVQMGWYYDSEADELVAMFILYHFWLKYNKNNNYLESDNCLTVFKNPTDQKTEKVNKEFSKLIPWEKIKYFCKMQFINLGHLGVTLNSSHWLYKPFHKPINKIIYI